MDNGENRFGRIVQIDGGQIGSFCPRIRVASASIDEMPVLI